MEAPGRHPVHRGLPTLAQKNSHHASEVARAMAAKPAIVDLTAKSPFSMAVLIPMLHMLDDSATDPQKTPAFRQFGRIRGDSDYPVQQDARGRACIGHTVAVYSTRQRGTCHDNDLCSRLSNERIFVSQYAIVDRHACDIRATMYRRQISQGVRQCHLGGVLPNMFPHKSVLGSKDIENY